MPTSEPVTTAALPVIAAIDAAVEAPVDAGPPLSEAVARQVIASRFRAAGFRVRHDVRLTRDGVEVTLDGYDPRHHVGFEYVAPSEANQDLDTKEHARLAAGDSGVLVVAAAPLEHVVRQVDAFLTVVRKRLEPDAGPGGDAARPAVVRDAGPAE